MATTTNYGWTTPDDTSLVKDGASAIRTLGSAIDTSLNTALGTKKAGLVLLNTTTFSGVASQAVNSCLSATYDNYLVLIQITSASANDRSLYLKLRVGTTDSNTNYNSFIAAGTRSGTGSNMSQSDDTNGYKIGELDSAEGASPNFACAINLMGPAIDTRSQMTINTAFVDVAGNFRYGAGAGSRTAGGAHTGINLIASAGTISGTIKVYGYQQ